MAKDNYKTVRESLDLSDWDEDGSEYVFREPTNGELLKLLDALQADLTDGESVEAERIKTNRWLSS